MKPFNFLSNQHTHKNSLRQWLVISLMLCVCFFITIIVISLRQIKLYSDLKRKKANLHKSIHKQAKLLNTYHISRKHYMQYQKLVALSQESRIFPHTYLNLVSSAIPIDVFLTEFSYSLKNKLRLHGKASSTRAITDFMRNLAQKAEFKTVSLVHITAQPELCSYEILLTL